jgi:hypothetical protein
MLNVTSQAVPGYCGGLPERGGEKGLVEAVR